MKEQRIVVIRIVICLLVFALFPLSSFAAFNLGDLGKAVTDVVSEQNGHSKLQEDYNRLQETHKKLSQNHIKLTEDHNELTKTYKKLLADHKKLSIDHKKLAIQKDRQIDRLTDTVVQPVVAREIKEAEHKAKLVVEESEEVKTTITAFELRMIEKEKNDRISKEAWLKADQARKKATVEQVARWDKENKESEERWIAQEKAERERRQRLAEIEEDDRHQVELNRKRMQEDEAKREEEVRLAEIAQIKKADEQRQASGLDLKDKYLDAHIFFPSYGGGPTEKWITLREFTDTLFSSPKAQGQAKISSAEHAGSIGFKLKIPGEKSVIFLFSYDDGDLFIAYFGTPDALESMAGAQESAYMGEVMKSMVKSIREQY